MNNEEVLKWFEECKWLKNVDKKEIRDNITIVDNSIHMNRDWALSQDVCDFVWNYLEDNQFKIDDDDHGTDYLGSYFNIGGNVYLFSWQYNEHEGTDIEDDFMGVFVGTVVDLMNKESNLFAKNRHKEFSRLMNLYNKCDHKFKPGDMKKAYKALWYEDNDEKTWKYSSNSK